MALFNELYYVADGGTIWTDGPVNPTAEQAAEVAKENYLGNFFYLEGHEYLMCNTYDVHFYARYPTQAIFLECIFQESFWIFFFVFALA